jgi:hypothetical protein
MAQPGSAPAWHAGGQGFESPWIHRTRERPAYRRGVLAFCRPWSIRTPGPPPRRFRHRHRATLRWLSSRTAAYRSHSRPKPRRRTFRVAGAPGRASSPCGQGPLLCSHRRYLCVPVRFIKGGFNVGALGKVKRATIGGACAIALAVGALALTAAPASAAMGFAIKPISCGVWGQWVHIWSTASGSVTHKLRGPLSVNLYMGSSVTITRWDAGFYGGTSAASGSSANTTGQ